MTQAQPILSGWIESSDALVCGEIVSRSLHFDVQQPIAPGGAIHLYFTPSPYYHTPPIGLPAKGFIFFARVHFQTTHPAGAGYLTAAARSGKPVHIDLPPNTFHFSVICDDGLDAGDRLTVTIGDRREGGPGVEVAHHPTYADWPLVCEVDRLGDGEYIRQSSMPALRVVAAPPSQVIVRAPSQAAPGVPTDLHIMVTDPFGNYIEGYTGEFETAVDGGPSAIIPRISLERGDDSTRLAPASFTLQAPGVHRIVVKSMETDGRQLEGVSNPIMCMSPTATPLWWGDLHGHSYCSDGTHSPEFYYRYARTHGYLDFCALTDHDIFTPAMWQSMMETAEQAYAPGYFTTFLGYEWSGDFAQSIGVVFKCAAGDYFPGSAARSRHPQDLVALIAAEEAMIIRHDMPLLTQRWQRLDPSGQMERLVEIYSTFHTSETPDSHYARGKLDGGNCIQAALADGLRFGFIASSDTHLSMPGRRLGATKGYPGAKPRVYGLTAVYATGNTREEIFAALHARRCYAATDRIYLDFRLNGHWMGEEVRLQEPRVIQVRVAGTAALAQVDVLKNNQVVHCVAPAARETSFEYVDPAAVMAGDYYYLRVIQTDGGLAWASPIWVDPV